MRHPTTRALLAYWEDLRAGRRAPHRNEVEATAIGEVLPFIFILDCEGGLTPRFRHVGDAVCALAGLALDKMTAVSMWDDASRRRITQLVEGVVSAPATAAVLGEAAKSGALAGAAAEFCFLPMRSDSGAIDRVIGAVGLLEGEPVWTATEPRLFSARDMRLTAIRSDEAGDARPQDYPQQDAPDLTAMAEPPAPFELRAIDGKFSDQDQAPIATPDRARPHLRVVRDDE